MPHTNNSNQVEKEKRPEKKDFVRKSDFDRKAFGEKKGGKGNKRTTKEQRKKGQPKWKNVVNEIEQLESRILEETPPSGVMYYKY